MSAYIHGSLALEQRKHAEPIVVTKKKVYSAPMITIKEKLMYLFIISLCVLAAGVIIWKYTQIYEVNTKIQQVEREIKALEIENNNLKLEINKLQDPKKLMEKAGELGYVYSGGERVLMAPRTIFDQQDAVAFIR